MPIIRRAFTFKIFIETRASSGVPVYDRVTKPSIEMESINFQQEELKEGAGT